MMFPEINEIRYVTARYVRVRFEESVLYAGFGSIQKKIEGLDKQKIYLQALSSAKVPASIDDLSKKLMLLQNYCQSDIDPIIDDLIKSKFIISVDEYSEGDPFSRNHLYYLLSGGKPSAVQADLRKKHVAILGCGGIGNFISYSLLGAGVGKLTLIDGDHVEASNITRQVMFSNDDVGKYKVDVLRSKLEDRSINTIIRTKCSFVTKAALSELEACDLLVLSADSKDIIFEVNEYCVANDVSYLSVGYVNDVATWGPMVVPGSTGCFVCTSLVANTPSSIETEKYVSIINNDYQAPSTAAINMLAASYASMDILKYLGGFGNIQSLNQRVGIWTHDLKIEFQSSVKNHECKTCTQK